MQLCLEPPLSTIHFSLPAIVTAAITQNNRKYCKEKKKHRKKT